VERFTDLTEEEIVAIYQEIKWVDEKISAHFETDSYIILQKNGSSAGQTVPHLHFHYIPRHKKSTSPFVFILQFLISPLKKPLSGKQITSLIEKVHDAPQRVYDAS